MAIWLNRAGSHGQYENKFIQDNRVYCTSDDLNINLTELSDRNALINALLKVHPDAKANTLRNWASQIWPFAHEMKKGDLVILPHKSQHSIYIGEITSDYHFDKDAKDPYYHWRSVKWIGESIPRANFGKDLLYSFGAFMTICRIQRNNAEARINSMRENGWKPESIAALRSIETSSDDELSTDTNLEELAQDQIGELITARFKGHDLTRLVETILKAQGYTTYRSPEGADGGADILAGGGQLGFGLPRIVVEVKSGDTPIDRPTVDKLIGAISKFQATEGLFVSWGGFKNNVQKELSASFFKVRLWTQKDLMEQLFTYYDRLDEDIKAELPLKRIWTVAAQEEE